MNTITPSQALAQIRARFPQANNWSVAIGCSLAQYPWHTPEIPSAVHFTVNVWRGHGADNYIECCDDLAAAVERILAHAEPAPAQPVSAADSFVADLLEVAAP